MLNCKQHIRPRNWRLDMKHATLIGAILGAILAIILFPFELAMKYGGGGK